MAEKHDPIKGFAIILSSVAKIMGEQKLTCAQTILTICDLIGDQEQPDEVSESMAQLSFIDDELELRTALGQESLRLSALSR